jgi:RNA polymerase sigma-B factor
MVGADIRAPTIKHVQKPLRTAGASASVEPVSRHGHPLCVKQVSMPLTSPSTARQQVVTADAPLRHAAGTDYPELPSDVHALVMGHLSVADAVARRYRRTRQEFCDLQQVARMGLVKAALRFRAGDGTTFVSFAVPTISGEIKRYLRDHSWMIRPPRPVQELRAQVNALVPELGQELGREPTPAELAARLDVDLPAIREALQSVGSMRPDSLDSQQGGEDGSGLYEYLRTGDDAYDRIDEMVSLAAAMQDITPWERQLLHLRFHQDLKQREIAAELGITQMQVSRILANLLDRLRLHLSA